ncbi:MAG TPA: proton-conducting transporter membrane subunit [Marinagarivorans sp.]
MSITELDATDLAPLLVLAPILGAAVALIFRRMATTVSLLTTALSALLVVALSCVISQNGAANIVAGGWPKAFAISLYVDGLTLLMLAITGIVGFFVALYAKDYFSKTPNETFWSVYLLLLAAINALALSRDIFNIYVTLECLGLASVALVVSEQNEKTLSSALRYLMAALVGSMLYLFGVAFLYHNYGTLNIDLLSNAITHGPVTYTAMALMVSGLMIKAAIFPLHFWLPAAHSSAPAPVSAILSALVVKASAYLIIRLWLDLFSPLSVPMFAELLSLIGMVAIIWGSIQALLQTRLKLLIAYSTVAQLGYLMQGFVLASETAWQGVIYIALSHALAKSAMFLAAGNIRHYSGDDRIGNLNEVIRKLPITMTAFAIASMSIMGLPPSSGFIGKWLLLEAALTEGRIFQAVVMAIGGILASAYIFKVIGHAFTPGETAQSQQRVTPIMSWTTMALALLSILAGFSANELLALFSVAMNFPGAA